MWGRGGWLFNICSFFCCVHAWNIVEISVWNLSAVLISNFNLFYFFKFTESEKDEFSDEGNSPKSTTSSQKFTKSSYYVELGIYFVISMSIFNWEIFTFSNLSLNVADPDLDPNQRIEVLESKLQELRKAYLSLKQELSSIDKRRKKLRRREREGKLRKYKCAYGTVGWELTRIILKISGRMMTRNEANSLL